MLQTKRIQITIIKNTVKLINAKCEVMITKLQTMVLRHDYKSRNATGWFKTAPLTDFI